MKLYLSCNTSECSSILREKAGRRSTGALNTPTLLRACFQKFSMSASVRPAHAFHIGTVIGASRFVLPAAHILWWQSVINNSTHLGGFSGTSGPLVFTRVVFSFSVCEHWIFSFKSSKVVL